MTSLPALTPTNSATVSKSRNPSGRVSIRIKRGLAGTCLVSGQLRINLAVVIIAGAVVVVGVMVVPQLGDLEQQPIARVTPGLPFTKVWSWASYSMSPSWFFICKMGIIIVFTSKD